jgi:hypothetical protein
MTALVLVSLNLQFPMHRIKSNTLLSLQMGETMSLCNCGHQQAYPSVPQMIMSKYRKAVE